MGPWLVIRDFNKILAHKEKCGGQMCPKWQLVDFRGALNDCELCEIGFLGSPLT